MGPIFGMHWLSWLYDFNFLKLLRFPICMVKGHKEAYTGNYTYCPRCMTQWRYED